MPLRHAARAPLALAGALVASAVLACGPRAEAPRAAAPPPPAVATTAGALPAATPAAAGATGAPRPEGAPANEARPATTSVPAGAPASPTGGAPVPAGAASGAAPAYGNRYADGVLPVGDGLYSTAGPRKGSIYLCNANFVPAGQAGAQARGPWFQPGGTTWASRLKVAVLGAQAWPQASLTMSVSGGRRIITTNGLPSHATGTFPVSPSDPAYQYDRNPNRIAAQSLRYDLPASPTGGGANCVGGEAGVMLDGVPLFNGFDAGGRDAQAWEVQDACGGHPQRTGVYHYHGLSPCVVGADSRSVIGFALDGFPLTGSRVAEGNVITSADLDECHGMTSEIVLDGRPVTMYHYVMTQDFPYSVSCFRGAAIRPPGPPGG